MNCQDFVKGLRYHLLELDFCLNWIYRSETVSDFRTPRRKDLQIQMKISITFFATPMSCMARVDFKDIINPMCPVNDGVEDTEHILLLFNSFREQICSLLAGVNDVLEACGHFESADINMLQLFLYGNKYLPLEANKLIFNVTMKYISETERFG